MTTSGTLTTVGKRSSNDMLIIGLGSTFVVGNVVFLWWNQDRVLFTDRLRLMVFTWEQERDLFQHRAILEEQNPVQDQSDQILDVDKDPRAKLVHMIAVRLIHVLEQDFPQVAKKLNWSIEVRLNPSVNAFCTPGGKLVVFSGLVDWMVSNQIEKGALNDSTSAIAAVIAHELAHGVARHGMERISWLPLQIPFLFFTPDQDILWQVFDKIVRLPHSRIMEKEADLIGFEILARCGCFDVEEAPKMLRILDTSGALCEWVSTHPVGETRAAELELLVEEKKQIAHLNQTRFPNRIPSLSARMDKGRVLFNA